MSSQTPIPMNFVKILSAYLPGLIVADHNILMRIALSTQTPVLMLLTVLISLILLTLCFINLHYKQLNIYRHKIPTAGLIYTFFFSYGIWSALKATTLLDSNHFAVQKSDFLKIIISNDPRQKNGFIDFQADVCYAESLKKLQKNKSVQPSMRNCSGRMAVKIKPEVASNLSLNYGDQLIIPAVYHLIPPPDHPSLFDYRSWLNHQGIHYQANFQQRQVIILQTKSGQSLIRYALKTRNQQLAFYRKFMKNKDAYAVASTLILGERANLSAETLNTYSVTGTIHALSVSGMHVGLIYLVINFLLSLWKSTSRFNIIKTTFIIFAIWYYALISGLSPSVLRSVIMLSVFVVAKQYSKTTNSYNIIAFTAFCLLVYQPLLIWDTGFQLSFLAVLGLIYLQPKLTVLWPIKNNLLNQLWKSTTMSCAAQLFTFPFSIYYFHQFPLYFMISNLFILLPIAALMYLGLAILLFRMAFLIPLFEWLIIFTNKGLTQIAELPYSSITGIWISKTMLIILCVSILLGLVALFKRQQHLLLSAVLCIAILHSMMICELLRARQQRILIRMQVAKTKSILCINGVSATFISARQFNQTELRKYVNPLLAYYHIRQLRTITLKNYLEETHKPSIFEPYGPLSLIRKNTYDSTTSFVYGGIPYRHPDHQQT